MKNEYLAQCGQDIQSKVEQFLKEHPAFIALVATVIRRRVPHFVGIAFLKKATESDVGEQYELWLSYALEADTAHTYYTNFKLKTQLPFEDRRLLAEFAASIHGMLSVERIDIEDGLTMRHSVAAYIFYEKHATRPKEEHFISYVLHRDIFS